jgi:hypothetical protein
MIRLVCLYAITCSGHCSSFPLVTARAPAAPVRYGPSPD